MGYGGWGEGVGVRRVGGGEGGGKGGVIGGEVLGGVKGGDVREGHRCFGVIGGEFKGR